MLTVDHRNPRRKRVTIRSVVKFYGQRPKILENGDMSPVWFLSPYEFVSQWEPRMVRYPLSLADYKCGGHDVDMTEASLQRLKNQAFGEPLELIPGEDYTAKASVPVKPAFPDVPSTETFRHSWVLVQLRRPRVPVFGGSPLPRHRDGAAGRRGAIVMS